MHWQGQFYVDLRLPFSLRSSPFLFGRLANAFKWVLKNNHSIHALMHYLDDYFTVGPPPSPLCASHIQTMVRTADRLGIPLAPDKLEGPTTQLVFLGIMIDSHLMECSLPPDKLSELMSELQAWSSRKKCLKRELLSLIRKLNFACRIIPAGRIFLRRLLNLSTTARLPHHHISLNTEARRDIAWWLHFLPLWNGRAIFPDPFWSRSPDLELFTDASGGLGFGVYFHGHWLNGSWPPNLLDCSIQWKELYPIALACLLWGSQWRAKNCSFTVITNPSWTFGPRVPPVTPSLCTSSSLFSSVLPPTSFQFSFLTFVALTTLLLMLCPAFRWSGSANSPPKQIWNPPHLHRRPRRSGWSPSLSTVPSHRPLNPPCLPS